MLIGLGDSHLQTRVRFPVALPTLSIPASITYRLSSDSHNSCLCSVLCSLHDFVSLVDHRPDLIQAGMLVQTGNVHFAVAHDIHHGHYIACSVHRIGSESVPGTIEHNGLGQTRQLLGTDKLLLHRLNVA